MKHRRRKLQGSIINQVKEIFLHNPGPMTVWEVQEAFDYLYSVRDLNMRLRLLVKEDFLIQGEMRKAGPYKQLYFTYSLNRNENNNRNNYPVPNPKFQ